jgi:hypothetical protein
VHGGVGHGGTRAPMRVWCGSQPGRPPRRWVSAVPSAVWHASGPKASGSRFRRSSAWTGPSTPRRYSSLLPQ